MKTGGDVIGVALALRGLVKDLLWRPAEVAEVIGQQDTRKKSRGGRAATHAEGNLVLDLDGDGGSCEAEVSEDLGVGHQDEVVVETAAELGVSAGCGDREGRGPLGAHGEEEGHRQAHGIEGGAEIGGGGGKPDEEGRGAHRGLLAHTETARSAFTSLSRFRRTRSASASSTSGARRMRSCSASSCAVAPASSSARSSVWRW